MVKSFYINNIVYYLVGAGATVFVLSYFYPSLFRVALLLLLLIGIAVVVDALLIYSKIKGIAAGRVTPERFSIGDENKVLLRIDNHYPFPVRISVIDELPDQFQER